jgi:hypothetical protein
MGCCAEQGGIDTVVGTKSVQMWGTESNNGVRKRVMGALSFAVFWADLWDDISYALKWRKRGLDRLVPKNVSAPRHKVVHFARVVSCEALAETRVDACTITPFMRDPETCWSGYTLAQRP